MSMIKAFIADVAAATTMKLRDVERAVDHASFENRMARMTSPREREAYRDAFIMLVATGFTPWQIKLLATSFLNHEEPIHVGSFASTARDELKSRLNLRLRGKDPGHPACWKGLRR